MLKKILYTKRIVTVYVQGNHPFKIWCKNFRFTCKFKSKICSWFACILKEFKIKNAEFSLTTKLRPTLFLSLLFECCKFFKENCSYRHIYESLNKQCIKQCIKKLHFFFVLNIKCFVWHKGDMENLTCYLSWYIYIYRNCEIVSLYIRHESLNSYV